MSIGVLVELVDAGYGRLSPADLETVTVVPRYCDEDGNSHPMDARYTGLLGLEVVFARPLGHGWMFEAVVTEDFNDFAKIRRGRIEAGESIEDLTDADLSFLFDGQAVVGYLSAVEGKGFLVSYDGNNNDVTEEYAAETLEWPWWATGVSLSGRARPTELAELYDPHGGDLNAAESDADQLRDAGEIGPAPAPEAPSTAVPASASVAPMPAPAVAAHPAKPVRPGEKPADPSIVPTRAGGRPAR